MNRKSAANKMEKGLLLNCGKAKPELIIYLWGKDMGDWRWMFANENIRNALIIQLVTNFQLVW